ncbi:MAG: hypothetical protein MZV64_05000 [Ignavibacteriales bacterium]|nr:hypothetical protein [Ignavibacteriales bacterium]
MTLIGTPAKIASSMAGRPSARAGDLDEQVRALRPRVNSCFAAAMRARGVVGEQRRDLERDPAVDAVGAVVDGPEQVGGPRRGRRARARRRAPRRDLPCARPAADRRVVGVGLLLMAWSKIVGFEVSPVTDKLVDVPLERAARRAGRG